MIFDSCLHRKGTCTLCSFLCDVIVATGGHLGIGPSIDLDLGQPKNLGYDPREAVGGGEGTSTLEGSTSSLFLYDVIVTGNGV